MILSPAQRMRAGRRVTEPESISAPLLGWNTRDPFEAMQPTDAILMDNWFPDFGGISIRKGTKSFAYGMGGGKPTQTLAEFATSAVDQFLAASGGAIYDITAGGTVGSALGVGFASDVWQTVEFNGHLFFANGFDSVQIYDGAVLSAASFTGVTTSTLSGISVIHERLFFWTGKDPSFWYGPVNGIAGPLVNFPLDMESQEGGNLIAVEVFSYDGGQGIDSYTCFFISSGELLLYSGSDPSNPNNWALVARYVLPPPVAMRAIVRYGGDIYLATANDHQQLSKILIALRLGETPPRTKISGAASAAFQAGGSLPGWQALYYPLGTRLIFNIPNPDGTFDQHVFNTSVQAWCRFKGMSAYCWGIYKNNLYFGSDNGTVLQADTGSLDTTASGSNPIMAASQQAWQNFGSPLFKRLAASRIVVQTNNQGDSYLFETGYDYQALALITPVDLPPLTGPLWGQVNWGAFNWASASGFVDTDWRIEGGEGFTFAWGIVANSRAPTLWVRTDFLLEPGRML
jgi:hypothetical protein